MITLDSLNQFTGTEQYYRHISGLHYTDGVAYLAREAGAFWLIDEVMFGMLDKKMAKYRDFAVWILRVNLETKEADLIVEDGNDNVISKRKIGFTTFPLAEISLWFENGVLILPSEH